MMHWSSLYLPQESQVILSVMSFNMCIINVITFLEVISSVNPFLVRKDSFNEGALVLHLHNKSDIPGKSVQSIWRTSTANQSLSLLIFQEQGLYQLSGGSDIYSDVSKKTAGEEGRGLHECHLLKKTYFSCKDDSGITLFSLKNLILTTPCLFGKGIWTQAFSNQNI